MIRSTTRLILSNRRWHNASPPVGTPGRSIACSLASSDDQQFDKNRRNVSTAPLSSWHNVGTNACNIGLGSAILSRGSSSVLPPSAFTSKRQMSSSSSPGDQDTTVFSTKIDDPMSTSSLPSFGSSPITPEVDTATTEAVANAISATPFEATWWPSDQCLLLLNYVHDLSGFPYAYTIAATTLGVRLILFPLFVKGQRNSSRMAHMQPELKLMKDNLDRMGGNPDVQTQQRYMNQTKALFKKYDCNPLMGVAAPLASAPFFLSMFFSLKNAPEHFPELLSTGGMLWFPDLTLPDPYFIMPVLSAATFLAMTELGKEQMMASDPAKGAMITNVFRAMAIVMVPLTAHFNSAVFVYWMVNNSFSLFQTLLLKQGPVKKAFGIWDPPKPVPGQETRSIMEEVKRLMTKKEEETNALAADRIKAHNEIVAQQKKVKKALMDKDKKRRN